MFPSRIVFSTRTKGICVTFESIISPRQYLNWNWNILRKLCHYRAALFFLAREEIFNFSLSRHVEKTLNEVKFIKKFKFSSLSVTHLSLRACHYQQKHFNPNWVLFMCLDCFGWMLIFTAIRFEITSNIFQGLNPCRVRQLY